MSILKLLLSKRWILSTMLVLVVSVVFVRLGFWQLDRMRSRQSQVAQTRAQIEAPVLIIDAATRRDDWLTMEYRKVVVSGEYDLSGEVVLRNQIWVDANNVHYNGVHLLTPLKISGTDHAILVDRGWIPANQASPEMRNKYRVDGTVTISGLLRKPQDRSEMGLVVEPTLLEGESRRDVWNFADVEGIAQQLDYPLLPVYVQIDTRQEVSLPYIQVLPPDLDEGANLGFAFQWFVLAIITLVGYPILVRKREG